MKFFAVKKFFLLMIACAFIFGACKKKSINSHPSWNTNLLTPLAHSTLGFNNIIADSLLSSNPDHSLQLVYKSRLYDFNLQDEFIKIPDSTIKVNYSLDSIGLANKQIIYNVSLGKLCSQLGLPGQLIIGQNGNFSVIPAIGPVSSTDNPIDASQFFQTATLQTGFIDITLDNGFPIDMDTCVFQVRNSVSGSVVMQDTFIHLLAGTSQTKTENIGGQVVEGQLIAKILDMYSPGSQGNPVLIDTTDALKATLTAHDMTISSATAIFPQQNLIDQNQNITYTFDGNAQLKKVRVLHGQIKITVKSTIEDSTYFQYSLPGATSPFGAPVLLTHILNPAPAGGTSSYTQLFDLTGYTLDLTGPNGNLFNTITNHLIARIDSTGNLVTISNNDSVYIDYGLINIQPEYAEGYLGQHIQQLNGDADFPLFNKIKSGSLQLDQLNMNVGIENGVGCEGRVILDDLTSINTKSGNSVSLNSGVLHSALNIPRSTDNPLIPSYTNFPVTSSNSNIKALVENLPDKFHYAGSVFVNPFGNTLAWHDFVYYNSNLGVDLQMDMPLSFIANQLMLVDTLNFSLAKVEAGKPEITDGVFNLVCENTYPLSANIQLYFYDDNFNFIDSLMATPHVIDAGIVSGDCIVHSPTKSVLSMPVDFNKMQKLKTAQHVVVFVTFNSATTSSCGGPLKIYSDYKVDVTLTGKFNFYTGTH